MLDHNSIQKILDRCSKISGQPLEDSSMFGPRQINDPETGGVFEVKQYSIERNQTLLIYLNKVIWPFENLYNCLKDLFFFETLLSAENFPDFEKSNKYSDYLRLTYQHWLIKSHTCFDCILQSLNAIFELGLKPITINRKKIIENDTIRLNDPIKGSLEKLNKLLQSSLRSTGKSDISQTHKDIRDKIIHYNEFNHDVISSLTNNEFIIEYGIFDLDVFDFQHSIGNTSFALIEEVKAVNEKMLTEIYPIFEFLNEEYNNRFKEKLIE